MEAQPTTEFDRLLFDVRRSVRYHDRRVSFYDRSHKLVLFIILAAGSTGMAAFATEMAASLPIGVKLLPGALVSVAAALDLVLGFPYKARLHDQLKQRFVLLESWMHRRRSESPEALAEWTASRLEIEANEPPVLRVLDTLCHNELLRAMGYPSSEIVEVKFYQRIFSSLFDLRADAL